MSEALYVHRSALGTLPRELRDACKVAESIAQVPWIPTVFNIARRSEIVTLLSYPEFDIDPHPALAAYVVVDSGRFVRKVDCTQWVNSRNTPSQGTLCCFRLSSI